MIFGRCRGLISPIGRALESRPGKFAHCRELPRNVCQYNWILSNMIVRYVYGTMIGESMTRDTKSAGAGAMRVVVRVTNFISISSNIRNFINLSININMISSITKASTKGSVLGWCLDALLPSHHLCLHWKPQGTKVSSISSGLTQIFKRGIFL